LNQAPFRARRRSSGGIPAASAPERSRASQSKIGLNSRNPTYTVPIVSEPVTAANTTRSRTGLRMPTAAVGSIQLK
jgi:hypothetical protein